MQYELRQQVIDTQRPTFTSLINRYGGRPATRYEEGSVDIQATENFHYRPLWDPGHELYDPAFSALRLADPYSFLDPRQFYYAPYVTSRAQLHDAFGKTLDYLVQRDLVGRLPEAWHTFVADLLLPLRHYESGAQLITVNGARFVLRHDGRAVPVLRGVRPDRQRADAQQGRHRARRQQRRAARTRQRPPGWTRPSCRASASSSSNCWSSPTGRSARTRSTCATSCCSRC